ncbi:MAG: GAF domain-containing protein, partial [Anaerolineales bacterium]|nr:GAF domain-containing protein [Anaerolineales bacterium]
MSFDGRYESYLAQVLPEDLPEIEKTLDEILKGQVESFRLEHRIRVAQDEIRWVVGHGQAFRDEQGRPTRLTGTMADITTQKQAEEALHRYTKRLEILHRIDSSLVAAESPQAIAQAAAENVQRLVGCERVCIPLFDFQNQEVVYLAATSTLPTTPLSNGLLSMAQYGPEILAAHQQGGPYLVEDTASLPSPPQTPPSFTTDHLRAWLCMPMFYHGELIGALNLGSRQPHYFTDEQRDIAREVANQLAIALHQSRLSKETGEALLREQRLNKVARTLSSTLDISTILPFIVQMAVELVGADAGMMGLLTSNQQTLTYPYLLNLPDHLGLALPTSRGEGVAWRVIQTQKGLLLNDYRTDPAALPRWLEAGVRGLIEVPLIAGETCLGVLGVYRFDVLPKYQPRDLALAETIGQQAGIAIQNARLFAATGRQLQELSVLRAGAEAGASALSEDELLEHIVHIVHEALYPDVFGIGLWDAEAEVIRPHPASQGLTPRLLKTTFRLGEGVVGMVAAQRRPWRIADVTTEPTYRSFKPEIRAELAVPILAGDRLLGILDVESKTPHAFTEDDERLLTTLAGQLAAAIDRLRAEGSLRANEIRRREMLEKVILLGKTITQMTDLDKCLQQIHQSIQRGLGFDRVGLFLYDAQTEHIQAAYGTNREGEIEDTSWFIQPAATFEAWLLALENPRGFHLVENFEETYPHAETLEMDGVKQHLTMAAWAGEKPVALISVDNLLTNRRITNMDIEALQLFAGYVGLAIENARWNAQLEQRVNERTAQLEATNQELESFSYSISHDLRAPLRAMDGFSTMLNMAYSQQMDAEGQRYIQLIRDNVQRMTQLINDLLSFSRLSRQSLHKQFTDPHALARQVIEELSLDLVGREVHFEVGQLPPCQADPSLLRQVFANLIGNAVKYTRPRATAHIQVDWQLVESETVYFVRDNGVGFDMEYAHKLFGVFQRLHSRAIFEGTGIGLAIVQRIITRHGGKVWAEAEVDHGASFYFTLG